MNVMITPEDAVVIENRAYFIINEFNGLFYSDLGEEMSHFLTFIPGEEIKGTRLYSSLQSLNNRYICMIPFYAREIGIYDIELHTIYKIDLPSDIKNREIKFMASAVIDNNIYLFELFGSNIYRVDVLESKCESICSWGYLLKNVHIFDGRDAFFRYQTQIYNGRILVPFCNANSILIYDYKKNLCTIKNLGTDENGYAGIGVSNDCVFCGPRRKGGHGIIWNLIEDEVSYWDESEGIIIGVYIKDNTGVYCMADDYSFLKSDENLSYDMKERVIKYIDDNDDRKWNVSIDSKNIESEIPNASLQEYKLSTPIVEEIWFGLKPFLRGI